MRIVPLVLFLFGSAFGLGATNSSKNIARSDSDEVDALVANLVSKRPPAHPSGYAPVTDQSSLSTPEVSGAVTRLKSMGLRIYPALVTHIKDNRYSYSMVSGSWVNLTVGDAVINVLSEGTWCPYEYKDRNAPSGHSGSPQFAEYLKTRGPEQWAEWTKDKTRTDIQIDFLQWCLEMEKKRGFVDDTQRKDILDAYAKALAEYAITTGQSIDALIQSICKVIPNGWTVSYKTEDSWLAISKDDPVWLRSESPNASSAAEPEKGQFTLAFRISPAISSAQYEQLAAENTNTRKEMADIYQDLINRRVNRKFDEFFPKNDTDKAIVARYETLKKSLHELPEYYYRDISLETGLPPVDITDAKNHDECSRVQEEVLNLLFKYDGT